jgi:hypothetical protein
MACEHGGGQELDFEQEGELEGLDTEQEHDFEQEGELEGLDNEQEHDFEQEGELEGLDSEQHDEHYFDNEEHDHEEPGSVLFADCGELHLPKEGPAEWLPAASATEALSWMIYEFARIPRDNFRLIWQILKHPSFDLSALPSIDTLDDFYKRLPLLPYYKLGTGPTASYAAKPSEILMQVERNPKIQKSLHFGATLVRCLLISELFASH